MGERASGSWPTEKASGTHRIARADLRWTRWIFLRLLAGVCLVAFWSLDVQIDGLIGPDGLLPATELFERAGSWIEQQAAGGQAVSRWELPSVFWWRADAAALHAATRGGMALSVLLMLGVAQGPILVALWVLYLSLVIAGQAFLGFQWDALLLETLVFAWFVVPWTLRPKAPAREPPPNRLGVFALRFLAFKLMFLSGTTKLLSGDPTWWGLTALEVHYQTQPLPSWVSWWAHQLPGWFHALSTVAVFVVEIVLPLFFFGPRRARIVAAAATILLQLGIASTGNYGFFNLLTIVLCVPLLDDRIWLGRRGVERPERRSRSGDAARLARTVGRWGVSVVVVFLSIASSLVLVREMVRSRPASDEPAAIDAVLGALDSGLLEPAAPIFLDPFRRFRSLNGYGLFRSMTLRRPEIVVEATLDGSSWVEVPFRYKPGDPRRAPPIVFLHMPRLDWQMWFAALSPRGQSSWLGRLPERLLEGSESVRDLLGEDPLAGRRPTAVRLKLHDYRFTTRAERRETGAWWVRKPEGTVGRTWTRPER